jgi:FtsH-binding integral membrane protein
MNTKKMVGYGLMLLGVLLLLIILFGSKFGIVLDFSSAVLWIVVIVLIGLGFFFSMKSKGQAAEEVPIYSGDKIIGYRRQ